MIDWKIFWDYFGKGLMFATAFTSAAILTVVILKDKEPVKSEHQLDYEEIMADTAIIKADLRFIDSTLRARKRAKSHNVLVEHMETCKHK